MNRFLPLVAAAAALRPLVELHRCGDYVVVDKPPGLCMAGVAAAYPGARSVHQLDKPTSGCLALALHGDAAREAHHAFRSRAVAKTYAAVVDGHVDVDALPAGPAPDLAAPPRERALPAYAFYERAQKALRRRRGGARSPAEAALEATPWSEAKRRPRLREPFDAEAAADAARAAAADDAARARASLGVYRLPDGALVVDAPVLDDGSSFAVDAGAPRGRRSVTVARVEARGALGGRPCTRLAVETLTGRRHQIRAHLALAGHPIAGDRTYGGSPAARLMLHATSLRLLDLDVAAPDTFPALRLDVGEA